MFYEEYESHQNHTQIHNGTETKETDSGIIPCLLLNPGQRSFSEKTKVHQQNKIFFFLFANQYT